MSQSNVIAAYLFIAFVVYITMRGELRTYMGFFFGGGQPAQAPNEPPPATNPNVNSGQQSNAGSVTNFASLFALGLV